MNMLLQHRRNCDEDRDNFLQIIRQLFIQAIAGGDLAFFRGRSKIFNDWTYHLADPAAFESCAGPAPKATSRRCLVIFGQKLGGFGKLGWNRDH